MWLCNDAHAWHTLCYNNNIWDNTMVKVKYDATKKKKKAVFSGETFYTAIVWSFKLIKIKEI